MTTAPGSPTGLLTAAARGPWIWIPVVVIFLCAPLFIGLDRTDLDNDEAIYSFAVDRMLADGDWLTPKFSPYETEAFLEKPPLKFWIVALPIRLGLLPDNEFGLRFWDAVFGGLVFLYVFAIGRRLGGPVCGLVAALALFVHRPLLMNHGLRSNNMEAALLLAYCGGVYHFLRWRSEANPRRQRLQAGAVALYFVLGFMTKFVAILFLPLALGASLLSQRDGRTQLLRSWRMWIMPGLLAIVLIAPWFLYQFHQFGGQVWSIMFGTHVVTRFTASLDPAHLHPWSFYIGEIVSQLRAEGMLLLAIAGAVVMLIRTVRRSWTDGAVILWWLVLPLTLMSLLTSKLYHYAYPFLPPVAIAAGYAVSVLADVAWSVMSRLGEVDRAYREWVRRVRHGRVLQIVSLVIGFVAIAIALVTVLHGAVSLSAWGHLLFRNSNPVRAGLIGVAALMISGRVQIATRAVLTALIVAAMLPFTSYRENLAIMQESNRPLRCVQQVSVAAGGNRAPGIWMEGKFCWLEGAPADCANLEHTFFYYLRTPAVGPWEVRDTPSSPTVYMNLYVPAQYRPVVLEAPRYAEFTRDVSSGEQDLIERAARKANMSAADLADKAHASPVGIVKIADAAVLLLPGPYAACAPRQVIGALK